MLFRSVVEEYGAEAWYERFVQKPLRTFIRESVQQYSSRDLKAHRDAIAADVAEARRLESL